MTLPAAVSITTAVVGLMIALLTLGFSAAPGWRELRYFALSAALAGLYAACNVLLTLEVSDPVITWGSRLSLLFGGLHAYSWFTYQAAQENRKLGRFETAVVVLGLLFGALALVPGALINEEVNTHAFLALGVTYRDAAPTPLGTLCYAFYSFGLLVLAGGYAGRWRTRVPGAGAHLVGMSVFFITGVNDALAGTGVIDSPYLLDVGFLVVVCAVGGAITSRFVASAAALQVSSRRLEEAQAELVKHERLAAQVQLSEVVAHEVRNPLGVIFNSLASLRRLDPSNAQGKALLAMMSEEADRLDRMVSKLLDLARPGEPKLAPACLETVLATAAEQAREAVGNCEEVLFDVATPLPPVRIDERMLREALVNLITNALQASGAGGRVRVRARAELPDEQYVRVEVIDRGTGVPAELAERIFTPFFTTRATGTGLGLAVVRRIAEAHRGKIAVEATPGGGATFVLRVPCLPSAKA